MGIIMVIVKKFFQIYIWEIRIDGMRHIIMYHDTYMMIMYIYFALLR